MTLYNAFSNLGIPVTKDISAIKAAYRKALSRHHPEEDPQGFMYLHQSYKTALAYAQGKGTESRSAFTTATPRNKPPWAPETDNTSGEGTGFDSLFSDLKERQEEDLSEPKKRFKLLLMGLRMHWLPIPLLLWQKLFSCETYLRCRRDEESLNCLFDLLVRKIHAYPVFRFLIGQLWELNNWQKSEGLEAAANKTRKYIAELQKQYSHYRKLNTESRFHRLFFSALWYYQALPFYFKLLATLLILPALAYQHYGRLLLLEACFYAMEYWTWKQKKARNLGLFYIPPPSKNGIFQIGSRGDRGIWVIATFYAIIVHLALCYAIANP